MYVSARSKKRISLCRVKVLWACLCLCPVKAGKARSKRGALPREEQTSWLSSAKWPVLKAYRHVALYEPNRLYLGT